MGSLILGKYNFGNKRPYKEIHSFVDTFIRYVILGPHNHRKLLNWLLTNI